MSALHSTRMERLESASDIGTIRQALAGGAVVIIAPAGMTEAEAKHAVLDATLGLAREPERPPVVMMLDRLAAEEATDG